jgi:hypothetical protein
VILEVARQLTHHARERGLNLTEPDRAAYRRSYSVEFNELMDQLLSARPDAYATVLIDEFDKAYAQLTDPALGYDEAFFSYLRGLTTRERVTVVLAGGEELPAMLRELGPTFNHAKRVRVSYLPIEAVRQLVRNPYVTWLDFPDTVIKAIYELTFGNPFFVQIICHELVDRACVERAIQVSTRDVEAVGRDLIALRLTVEQMAHLYEVSGRQDHLEMAALQLLCRGEDLRNGLAMKVDDLKAGLRETEGAVSQAVSRLTEREVIRNVPERPGYVQVVMPLFAAWFRQDSPLQDAAWRLLERPS